MSPRPFRWTVLAAIEASEEAAGRRFLRLWATRRSGGVCGVRGRHDRVRAPRSRSEKCESVDAVSGGAAVSLGNQNDVASVDMRLARSNSRRKRYASIIRCKGRGGGAPFSCS